MFNAFIHDKGNRYFLVGQCSHELIGISFKVF